ncbi:MAG: hypothetical protein QW247_07700 [Pyrobaculum sp.]
MIKLIKKYELLINLGYHYALSLASSIKRGVGVRNSYVFTSLIRYLSRYFTNIKIKALYKPNIKPSLKLFPFVLTKCCNEFQPLHMYLLCSAYFKIKVPENSLTFLHYYFDLCLYNYNNFTIVEIPESIIETAGYSARKRYGINLLRKEFSDRLRNAYAITVPTMRDTLSYVSLGISPNKIYVIYNVFPFPFTLNEINEIVCRNKKNLSIVIDGWGNYESRIRLALKIIRIFPNIDRIYITSAPASFTLYNGKIAVHSYLPRGRWLELLSKTSVFIFHPKIPWSGGHSVRLNDAALMGNIIFGGEYELRGEPYPHTFTYLDENDLIVKLHSILNKQELYYMGLRNHEEAVKRYNISVRELERLVDKVLQDII